jgi:hypothetical protein
MTAAHKSAHKSAHCAAQMAADRATQMAPRRPPNCPPRAPPWLGVPLPICPPRLAGLPGARSAAAPAIPAAIGSETNQSQLIAPPLAAKPLATLWTEPPAPLSAPHAPLFREAHSGGIPNRPTNHAERATSRLLDQGFQGQNPTASIVAASRLPASANLRAYAYASASSFSLVNSSSSGAPTTTRLSRSEVAMLHSRLTRTF